MGFRHQVIPRTFDQLTDLANPGAGSKSEALAWVLYDTATYPAAGSNRLTFFRQTRATTGLSNLASGGSLTDPDFFEIAYFGLDVLLPLTNVLEANIADSSAAEMQNLILVSMPFWRFNISNKDIGPFPASFLHASGGVTGPMVGLDNVAAGGTPTLVSVSNNGLFDGGFCAAQAIIIPPKVGFFVALEWDAGPTVAVDIPLRMWMAGTLHRRVL